MKINSYREEVLKEFPALIRLGGPIAFAHLAGILMQIVDTIFVSRLSPEAVGGVSVANAQFTPLMIVGVGLLLGLDFLISHDFGAGKIQECHRWLVQAIYIATFVSVPSTLLMYWGADYFHLFGVTPLVAVQAKMYMQVFCLSLWPFLLFIAFRQYLQAQGVAFSVLIILVVANLLNALFNWVFIFGHWGVRPMGVAGSAWATLLARLFMLFSLVYFILRRDRKLKLGLVHTPFVLLKDHMLRLLRLGVPAAGQCVLEIGVFAAATFLIARLGAIPLAAHQIVLQIASFTFMIPLGVGAAASVRVGQSLGAGHRRQAVHIGWIAIFLGILVMGFCGLTMVIVTEPLLHLFTKDVSVIVIGIYLLYAAAFFQVFDGIQVVTTGVLRGAGNTRTSMFANLIGHWFIGLPFGAFLCFKLGLGALGIWSGLSVGLVFVALILVYGWVQQVKSI